MDKKLNYKQLPLQESLDSLRILMPRANIYAKKGLTQRDYIKRSGIRLRTRGSPKVNLVSQIVLKPRLQVIGCKEKIEKSGLAPRIQNKSPGNLSPVKYTTRPCSCSPNNFVRIKKDTLTIKIPNNKPESDSDSDSGFCMNGLLKYNISIKE